MLNRFLFGQPGGQKRKRSEEEGLSIGTSGGYLHHILKTQQAKYPDSSISIQRGRNADVSEYTVLNSDGSPVFKAARYYGFRNIQNLVRRLKPVKASRMPGASRKPLGTSRKPAANGTGNEGEYAYVEVMACPGGCTNGGGQIKIGDVATLRQFGGTGVENGSIEQEVLPAQKEWLAKVDEAYWSAESDDELPESDVDGDIEMNGTNSHINEYRDDVVDGIDRSYIRSILEHWASVTGVELEKLIYTTYRAVESDVGKEKASDMEKVSALAVAQGGGW
jgi:hypothetical protein